MTGLLVSVRDVAEAKVAYAAGAAIVDLKEPANGSLGRADAAVARAVLDGFADVVPVSAALGELQDYVQGGGEIGTFEAVDGRLAFAKLGLAGAAGMDDWRARLQEAYHAMPRRIGKVAVAYADAERAAAPPIDEVIEFAAEAGCAAFLIDTYDKRGKNLIDLLGWDVVAALVERGKDRGLRVVLAGRVERSMLARLAAMGPDYVGVRGAACGGERRGQVRSTSVEALVQALSRGHERICVAKNGGTRANV